MAKYKKIFTGTLKHVFSIIYSNDNVMSSICIIFSKVLVLFLRFCTKLDKTGPFWHKLQRTLVHNEFYFNQWIRGSVERPKLETFHYTHYKVCIYIFGQY